MKNLKNISLALLGLVVLSCNNDDNTPPPVTNEEELITTVKVTLTNGGSVITLQSKDLDGDGPNAPVVTASGNLTANTTYSGIVEFLNESVNRTAPKKQNNYCKNYNFQFHKHSVCRQ